MSLIRYAPAPRSLGEILAPYRAFAAKAFSREATYRMEVFTNVGSLIVRLYLMKAVWTSLYAQNAAPAGVPLHAVLTYTVVALLMSLVLEIDGTRAIREKIREGTIATDLMKPISLPLYFFSDGVGMTLLHAILIVPALILSLIIVHIDVPPAHVLAAFALSFLLGYLVNFLLNFLMNCVAFWTLETFAIQLMVRWVSDLLSGQIVPLDLLPGRLAEDRAGAAVRGDLLHAAADLSRKDSAVRVSGRDGGAGRAGASASPSCPGSCGVPRNAASSCREAERPPAVSPRKASRPKRANPAPPGLLLEGDLACWLRIVRSRPSSCS